MYFKAFLQAWKLVLEKLEEEDANGKERQVQSRRAAEDTLMRFLAKQRWKNFFITFLLCLNLIQKSKTKNQSFTLCVLATFLWHPKNPWNGIGWSQKNLILILSNRWPEAEFYQLSNVTFAFWTIICLWCKLDFSDFIQFHFMDF